MVTSSAGTIIDVLAAVVPSPAIHAHALVAAVGVVARAAILAGVRHQLALINILSAKLTCSEDQATRLGLKFRSSRLTLK